MSLSSEMAHYADALKHPHCEWLRAHGGTEWPLLTAKGILGIGRAAIDPTGDRWGPDEAGALHFMVGVVEDGALVDIIAFSPDAPSRWALRTWNGTILGMDNVRRAQGAFPGEVVMLRMVGTPLEWIGDTTAACVIDGYSAQASAEIREVQSIDVPNSKLAQALRLQLTKPPRIPEINITKGRRHAA
ncbi:hypothetical protein SAMN06295912_1508 [Sphingomonas laterariae]|uniref:Uncharacterized protein n=1 Tax=Edaphosphingomonas laterariae TaxID=861865 RepID=A0A239KDF8_9SPHN|nr:hypothetical protein [Sphingomonas laterariae]SNT15742.1 hypothetical protein SAMN06295912_1508 [Sphingomonas laterariae]